MNSPLEANKILVYRLNEMKNRLKMSVAGIERANTDLREALAFLLDNPNDAEARETAERVLAQTPKADPGAA